VLLLLLLLLTMMLTMMRAWRKGMPAWSMWWFRVFGVRCVGGSLF
jgi:hypothetical protein